MQSGHLLRESPATQPLASLRRLRIQRADSGNNGSDSTKQRQFCGAEKRCGMGARRVAALADSHEHDWHVVQVDFDAGKPVSEYACSMCSEVWFS